MKPSVSEIARRSAYPRVSGLFLHCHETEHPLRTLPRWRNRGGEGAQQVERRRRLPVGLQQADRNPACALRA